MPFFGGSFQPAGVTHPPDEPTPKLVQVCSRFPSRFPMRDSIEKVTCLDSAERHELILQTWPAGEVAQGSVETSPGIETFGLRILMRVHTVQVAKRRANRKNVGGQTLFF